MEVTQKQPKYEAVQWDGQTSTADKIASMFDGTGENPYPYTIDGPELELMNEFSNTFRISETGWVVVGPYWDAPRYGADAAVWTNEQYNTRFE